MTLTITDCDSEKPISDLYVICEPQNSLIGCTNEKGKFLFDGFAECKELHFSKLGSVDTTITLTRNKTNLCLYRKVNRLNQVEIEGIQIPINKQFEQFIEKTVKVLPFEDDSLFYSFQYVMQVPDSGWECNVSGVLMIPVNSYKKANSGAFSGQFCKLNIEVNPEFYSSSLFSSLNSLSTVYYYLNYNLLRKRFAYRKRIKAEMIEGKQELGDSTMFYVRGFGVNRKYRFNSTPVFSEDSILIQDNVRFEHYDKIDGKEKTIRLALEESIMKYKLEKILRIESLEVNGIYNRQGNSFQVQFETKLLEKKFCECANIYIMTHFDKTSISEHPEIQVEFYPSDSIKTNGANKL